MRGSDVNWPADPARGGGGAPGRTGGSRLLLDELLAQRDHVEHTPPAPPKLTIEPVTVTPTGELGRRAIRRRAAELEDIARRNLRAAEEARRVLAEEHRRLQQESAARARAQDDAASLQRELDRLRNTEAQRAAQERVRAMRAARAEIANELQRFQEEHERVVAELDRLRGSMHDHDGLIEEYAQRLREEQQARATLRADLDRAEAERGLAERALEGAMETSKQRAEDELIQIATLESQLRDARSDRDRLTSQLAERDEELARLRAELARVNAELAAAVPPPGQPALAPPEPEPDAAKRPPLARRTRKPPPAAPLPIRRRDSSEDSARTVAAAPPAAEPVAEPLALVAPPQQDPPAPDSSNAASALHDRRSAMAELTAIAARR